MWDIWANKLLPKALKSCPKCEKSPNLVTLFIGPFCICVINVLMILQRNCVGTTQSNQWALFQLLVSKICLWHRLLVLELKHERSFVRPVTRTAMSTLVEGWKAAHRSILCRYIRYGLHKQSMYDVCKNDFALLPEKIVLLQPDPSIPR